MKAGQVRHVLHAILALANRYHFPPSTHALPGQEFPPANRIGWHTYTLYIHIYKNRQRNNNHGKEGGVVHKAGEPTPPGVTRREAPRHVPEATQ